MRQRVPDLVALNSHGLQHTAGNAVTLTQHAQEDVLCADVVVACTVHACSANKSDARVKDIIRDSRTLATETTSIQDVAAVVLRSFT